MTTEPTEQTRTVQVIECEVYSRVVGYYRPVSGWNMGKKQEFNERKPVKMPGESERKMNKVILIGRLGKDPELRHTQNADAVCNFTLATVERWKGRDGQKQEKTEWHKVTVWGPQAESVAQYLRKGDRAAVVGQIETRKWTDKEGNQRETVEIRADSVEFLQDRRPEEGRREKDPAAPAPDWSGSDDDIPF